MPDEFIVNQFINEEKSLSSFRTGIRGNIRGLWLGELTVFGFVDGMRATIELGFRQAWAEGAGQCGVSIDELTQQELQQLQTMTNNQFPYLPGFASDIVERDKAAGYPLDPHLDRGEMWISQYGVVVNRAAGMACGDRKKKWILGEAEHCSSCLKLNGKVKRHSFWVERGIEPQVNGAWYLDCRGYKCQCSLVDTDEPVSRGPLPGLR